MRSKHFIICLTLAATLLLPTLIFAEDSNQTNGDVAFTIVTSYHGGTGGRRMKSISPFQLFVGISTNWARLKGEEEGTNYAVAEMVSDEELGLVLGAKSMDSYFKNSSFGHYIEFGMETYSLHKDVNSVSGPVRTGLEGEYWYITPTVFYDFARRYSNDWSFKVGAGFGMGYLTADGIVALEPVISIKPVHGKDFGTSLGLILECTYKNWVFQAKEYTPSATIDGVDFKIELPTFIVGYRFD